MGDLLKNIKAASEGKPYKGDGMENQSIVSSNNKENQSSVMSDPRVLQHSLDGQKKQSDPRILIAEDESQK